MPTDADLNVPRWDNNDLHTWGPLGKPGTRTKEGIIEYVKKNSALGPEAKRKFAINLWQSELAFRAGEHYDPKSMTPYQEG